MFGDLLNLSRRPLLERLAAWAQRNGAGLVYLGALAGVVVFELADRYCRARGIKQHQVKEFLVGITETPFKADEPAEFPKPPKCGKPDCPNCKPEEPPHA